VAASMEYLDRRAAVVRYQVGDEPHYAHARLRPRASFTHGINRAMEPHLHDHVLVAGRARGVDRQLDSRSLLRHLRAADALYRAQLRHDLFEATGRTVWRYFSGRESVQGVGEGVIALWPGRSDERPPKASPSREQVTARWREQHSHALDVPAMAAPVWERGEVHHHSVMASISQRDQVGRADLVEAVANASVLGAPARDVESAVDRLFPELGRDRGLATRELSHGDVRRRLVQLEDRTRELQRSSRPLERSREGRSRVG